MKSPQSFFIGIGKGNSYLCHLFLNTNLTQIEITIVIFIGTGQFVSGLVVGTLESTSSLVGSYSAGISTLSPSCHLSYSYFLSF